MDRYHDESCNSRLSKVVMAAAYMAELEASAL